MKKVIKLDKPPLKVLYELFDELSKARLEKVKQVMAKLK